MLPGASLALPHNLPYERVVWRGAVALRGLVGVKLRGKTYKIANRSGIDKLNIKMHTIRFLNSWQC